MFAVLCNEQGTRTLGSDSVIHVDARKSQRNRVTDVSQYRERFKKNFPHKYDSWTHCYFVSRIADIDIPAKMTKVEKIS